KKEAEKRTQRIRENDCMHLYRVAREMERPHDVITRTLAKKTFKQRMKRKEKYNELFEEDLEEDLKKGLGNDWNLLIESLLNDQNSGQSEGPSKSLKVSDRKCNMNKLNSFYNDDLVAFVKKVTPLSNQELKDLKKEYKKENSDTLESDISKRYRNPLKRFLLALVKDGKKGHKYQEDSERDAVDMFVPAEERWTSSSSKFIQLVGDKNAKYMKRGKPATKHVQEECTKSYAEVVNAYINSIGTAQTEHADNLYKNLDPTNPVFVKTVVAKSENDMPKIRKEYKKKYGRELAEDLENESNHTTVGVLKAIIMKDPPKVK
ncbi:unnamed protein product, partial [Candidula unifasciata]